VLRRSFRFGLIVGVLGGVLAAVAKMLQGRTAAPAAVTTAPTWTPIPDTEPLQPIVTPAPAPAPAPKVAAPKPAAPKPDTSALAALQESPVEPKPAPAKKKAPAAKKKLEPWVQPEEGGTCPGTHPVKGKLTSKIFHVPGGFNYARTQPDRCYIDAAAAEADGLRQSKR
jgi:hypothetical protein